ncbi:hypothetical protein TNCV_4747791 [Trichonephila clavipes]|nr:hypothetical protein TNCV_4747791 [Trichonephila clavipes]
MNLSVCVEDCHALRIYISNKIAEASPMNSTHWSPTFNEIIPRATQNEDLSRNKKVPKSRQETPKWLIKYIALKLEMKIS